MILAILQARMSSTRLPGKVMRPLLGVPMIGRQIERLQRCKRVDNLVVATSSNTEDDGLTSYVAGLGLEVHRGSLDDVLGRFRGAMEKWPATHVVRLTADCPLADWVVIDDCIRLHEDEGADYTSNAIVRTFPKGLDVEVISVGALEAAASEAREPPEREHVTPFIRERPDRFRLACLTQPRDLGDLWWTVDRPEDFAFVEGVYRALYPLNPAFTSEDILRFTGQS